MSLQSQIPWHGRKIHFSICAIIWMIPIYPSSCDSSGYPLGLCHHWLYSDHSGPSVAILRVDSRAVVPARWHTPKTHGMESYSGTTHKEIVSCLVHNQASCFEMIQWHIRNVAFSEQIAVEIRTDARISSSYIYQEKWSTFCHWGSSTPSKATVQYIVDLFEFLQRTGFLIACHQRSLISTWSYIFWGGF